MILTPRGWLEFMTAGTLLATEESKVVFSDGNLYHVRATLVGPNKVRLDGHRVERPAGWARTPLSTMTLAATEVVPTIGGDQ